MNMLNRFQNLSMGVKNGEVRHRLQRGILGTITVDVNEGTDRTSLCVSFLRRR